ncbi:hypothetical protein MTR67_011893, partial [Solanum verrucosum]
MLRRYVPDESHVLQYDAVELDDRLTFVEEPVAILARDVRRLCSRAIPVVKVRWRHRPVEEATWETEHEMRVQSPDLFEHSVELDDRLTFVEEPVAILARDVRRLCSRAIPVVKVRWRHRPVEEATWETEHEMRVQSPDLFEHSVGEVAYELALPPAFSAIHPVFHVSMLRRYVPDESHVLQYDAVELDDRLTFVEEPVAILARDVRRLCSRAIPVVKVRWRHRPVEEATWETEHEMRVQSPDLFEHSVELDDRLTFVEEPVAILARDVRRLCSRAIPVVKVRWRHRPVEEATWETEHEMRVQSPDLFEHS